MVRIALLLAIAGMAALIMQDRAQAYVPCGAPQGSMPVRVWLNPYAKSYYLTNADLSAAVNSAMADWNNLPDSNIVLVRTDNVAEAKVRIDVGTFWTEGALAETYCNFGFVQRMNVSRDYSGWDLDPSDGIAPDTLKLHSVLRHEFGHVLGLQHSCVTPGAVMCGTLSIGGPIDADAQLAMATFYPMAGATPPPTPTATPTPTPPPAPVLTGCERRATYSNGAVIVTTLPLTAC